MVSTKQNYTMIKVEEDDGVTWVTLNRPEKLNAATDTMIQELNDAFFEFDADESQHVAIIRGAGRAFCSGADVQQRQLRPFEEMKRLGGPQGRGAHITFLSESVNWKPIISAVHGYALGLGLSLALDSDLVVAAEETKFQIREVERGIGGGTHWASTWFWSGDRFANEVTLTGRMFSAEEALEHGLVNYVVPYAELYDRARRLADEIKANPPLSVRSTVRPMRRFSHEMQEDVRHYTQALGLHLTEDFRESATAFIEKRSPVFKGR